MALSSSHPLAGTIAAWMWLLPVLPLLGFFINGALSILGSARIGPSDPDMGHGDHDTSTVVSEHAHGNDAHADATPKFRGLATIVGPGVLLLSFLLAAAEAAVGLAIIISIFRHRQTVDLRNINVMKG